MAQAVSKTHCSGEFSESETHLLRTKHFKDFHRPRRSIHLYSSSRLLCSKSGISSNPPGIAICQHPQKTLPVKTTKLLILLFIQLLHQHTFLAIASHFWANSQILRIEEGLCFEILKIP